MDATERKPTGNPRTRRVVGELLKAVDNVLVATEEVKRARLALAKEARRLDQRQGVGR